MITTSGFREATWFFVGPKKKRTDSQDGRVKVMFSYETLCSTSEKILARPLYYFNTVCVFAAVLTDYMLGVDNKIVKINPTDHLRNYLHFTTTVTSCCSGLPMVEGINSNPYFPSSDLCTPTIFSQA